MQQGYILCCLQSLGENLLTNQIPSSWLDQWSGPDQPLQFCSAVANKAVNLGQWVAAASAGQLWSQPVNISDLFNPGKECITNAAVTDADAKHAAGSQRNPMACNLQLVVPECQTVISKLVPSVHSCRWLSALCCTA